MLHDRLGEDEENAYLLRWVSALFYGDSITQHATNQVLREAR